MTASKFAILFAAVALDVTPVEIDETEGGIVPVSSLAEAEEQLKQMGCTRPADPEGYWRKGADHARVLGA